jgi:hypothetical protein
MQGRERLGTEPQLSTCPVDGVGIGLLKNSGSSANHGWAFQVSENAGELFANRAAIFHPRPLPTALLRRWVTESASQSGSRNMQPCKFLDGSGLVAGWYCDRNSAARRNDF